MEKQLRRNEQEGMLGGVCAGLGEYLGIDKAWVRVVFVLSVFFSAAGIGLIGPIAYVVMWIVLPRKPVVFPDFREPYLGKTYEVGGGHLFQHLARKRQYERTSLGFVLLFIGCFFLMLQLDFITWDELFLYWPLVFVIGGILTIFSAFKLKKVKKSVDEPSKEAGEGEKPIDTESDKEADK